MVRASARLESDGVMQPIELLRDLETFYTEHRKCGDVRGGVEHRDDGGVNRT